MLPISYSRIWYIRFRSRRCSRLIPKRNPPGGPLTFSYRRCIVLRPAVMGLYVERRCIRSGYASRILLQPSRQDMPNLPERKNGNEKAVWNQTRSCSQSTFFTILQGFLLSVLLQENKKGTNRLHFCNQLVPFRLLSSPSGDDLTILNSPAGHYHTVLRFHPRNLIDLQFPGSRVVIKLYPVSFAQQLVNRGYRFR